MPWSNRGGPTGGNGGGPWGKPGPRSPQPPNLEDLLRRGQDRLRRLFPGGLSNLRGLWLLAAAILIFWGISGFYRVQPDEQGVELLFGKYVKTTQPGLNYWFPSPVGEVYRPKVTQTNQVTVGFRGSGGNVREVPQESHILAGDQNIADIQFVVQWRIREAGNCLGEVFSIRVMKFAIPTVTLLFELKVEILLAGSLAHRLNIFLRADAAVKTEDVCRHGAWCVMPSS